MYADRKKTCHALENRSVARMTGLMTTLPRTRDETCGIM